MSYSSNRVSRIRIAVAMAAVALTGACNEKSEPSRITAPTAASRVAEIPRALRPHSRGIEDVFLKLEQTIPGFGGFFTDAEGNINVFVRDAGRTAAALGAVNAWAQAHTDAFQRARPARVIARVGQFAFSELVAWQGQIFDNVVASDEIRFIDADEAHNRVRIIVQTSNGLARVARLAATLGIPQDALMVEVGQFDFRLTSADLRTSTFRPVPAGVQMTNPINPQTSEGCTVGINVHVNGAERFLTASRCTRNFSGGAINQDWHQPFDPGNLMGFILLNPAWDSVGCGGGARYCRDTDSALGYYATGVSADFKIAETSTVGTGNSSGNTTVGHYWTVGSPQRGGPRMVGDTVYKTGKNTGTTKGPVTATCFYTTPPDPVYHTATYCASLVQMNDQTGDSGAPVYYWRIPLAPDVRIPEGIAYGTGTLNGTVYAIYSTWDQLEIDLGVTMNPEHP